MMQFALAIMEICERMNSVVHHIMHKILTRTENIFKSLFGFGYA